MIVTSEVTGRQYDTDNTIKIFNNAQYAKYIKHGAIIVDAGVENDKFFIRFNKIDVQPLFDLWCKYELN